jgi:Tim10/DDP family zinc finger
MLCCSLRMYNSLVEKCFRDCVDSFRRKDLESSEEKVRHLLFVSYATCSVPHACLDYSAHDYGSTGTLVLVQCVQRCCEKFMKHSSRVGVRFAELSAQAEQQVQQMMQK